MRQTEAVTDTPRPTRLTSEEVARVLHRAADIEATDHPVGRVEGYEAAAVVEAAAEVGLSPAAVHQAVAELRAGALEPAPVAGTRNGRRLPALGPGSRHVVHQRLVERSTADVVGVVDRFMRTQMFELRRRAGDRSLYRQRSDLMAHVRRRLDFAGAIKLDGLRTVDVVVTPADDERTLVRIQADLVASRANALAGPAAAGGAVTVVTGVVGAALGEAGLVLASLPAGALVAGGGMRVAGTRWQRRRDDVAEALASLLDRL
jgi:hypothetical protein